jgi:hypothetical protein
MCILRCLYTLNFDRTVLRLRTNLPRGGSVGNVLRRAAAQLELADAAIAMIVGCSDLANEAALATIGPSDGANPL